jgi:HK97 family phage major capsid protein
MKEDAMSELNELINQMKKEFAAYQDAFVERQNADGARVNELDTKMARIEASLNDGSQAIEDMRINLDGKVDEMEQVIAGLAKRKPVESEQDYARYASALTSMSRAGIQYDADSARDYSAAFVAMMRSGQPSNLLSVESDPDGGYLVPPDMSGRMIGLIRETSDVRGVASVTSTSLDALEGENDLGQVGFGWVGETTARTETTTSQLGQWRIPVHEMYAEPRATQRILDDAGRDVAAWLMEKVADRLARGENEAFISGSGVLQPRGLTTCFPA